MGEQAGRETLELEVRDFGPIVEAKINLRPLTVFVGPSNTGKSYLAILMYALHRALNTTYFSTRELLRKTQTNSNNNHALSEEIRKIQQLMEDSLDDDSSKERQDNIVLSERITKLISVILKGQSSKLVNELSRCFGIESPDTLIRKGQTRSRVTVRRRIVDHAHLVEYSLKLTKNGNAFETTLPSKISIPIDFGIKNAIRSEFRYYLRRLAEWRKRPPFRDYIRTDDELLSLLAVAVQSHIVDTLCLPAFYLPADRTGIMHAHSVVVSALIASAPRGGLRRLPASAPALSGVLADFLEQLINIDRPRRFRPQPERDLSHGIEKDIVGGSIKIDRSPLVNYPRFAYRPYGWKSDLALANSSSMVSELAAVVLYLRHLIRPNDVLIIEEPESHLHPAMQVEFTRQLAALINEGIRVVVTTHSEWLLEELANIVRRSQMSEKERSEYGADQVGLTADQVGVWLFKRKKRPKGSVVKRIDLDESGMYSSDFESVAQALHNDWADIGDRIEDGE